MSLACPSIEGQQRCKASLLSLCSACCSSAPICRLVKHEHYVSHDCVSPAARPASLCSAAVWRFKDLGLVLRNMFTILPKSDRLCHQICKHRCMHVHTRTHARTLEVSLLLTLYSHYASFFIHTYLINIAFSSICLFPSCLSQVRASPSFSPSL